MINIQKRLPLIIALVSGIVAMIFGNSFLQQREREVAAQARLLKEGKAEEILVAQEDIPKGATIEEKMVGIEKVPSKFIQPRATNSLERVVDKIALAPISKGEQILLSKVGSGLQDFSSLAYRTPPGKRAITIPVDNISSVGGMIRPGDNVDVLGIIPQAGEVEGKQVTQYVTVPLFQKVLVLAVGSDIGAGTAKGEKIVINTITIALAPSDATMIAFIQEQGKLRFILRSPTDNEVFPIQSAGWDTLTEYLFPGMMRRVQDADRPPPPPEVEVYMGTERKTMPLEK